MIIDLEPHETDRELIIEADSGAFYRSSVIQLDGGSEPAVEIAACRARQSRPGARERESFEARPQGAWQRVTQILS
jgi:hypothetical protein